jgi:MFS transporter, ACS family, DAL5 transporter family protein
MAFRSINAVYLYILNTRHQQERERLGKERKVVDWSMQVVRTVDKDKETALPAGEIQDNSLNDVTDIKNEDFVYVY